MKTALISILLSLAAAAACTVTRPASATIPPDMPNECAGNCATMGMKLQSVVVIMNSVGCVCVPADAPASASSGGAAAGGGAAVAAIIAAQESSRSQSTSGTSHH